MESCLHPFAFGYVADGHKCCVYDLRSAKIKGDEVGRDSLNAAEIPTECSTIASSREAPESPNYADNDLTKIEHFMSNRMRSVVPH